jgi:MYXO-CTERM domain-containing protein
MVSAATSVLALGALGMAARRRRRRDLVLAGSSDASAAAVAIASSAPAPPPAPDAPPPWQTLTGRPPSKFASNPGSGIERLTISYRFVRLSDGPDDLRSREISRLDRGDEVEVVAEQDGMLQVRTASGLVGWVPRVTVIG